MHHRLHRLTQNANNESVKICVICGKIILITFYIVTFLKPQVYATN